ncbi:MAG: hypothetical protein ACRCX7_11255 [Cetobacterium sp.]|uniref:hypothetical protein n=1 Tax=Cetobacterium sp. TaxID=2071632 RepID=UPI003F397C25
MANLVMALSILIVLVGIIIMIVGFIGEELLRKDWEPAMVAGGVTTGIGLIMMLLTLGVTIIVEEVWKWV